MCVPCLVSRFQLEIIVENEALSVFFKHCDSQWRILSAYDAQISNSFLPAVSLNHKIGTNTHEHEVKPLGSAGIVD